MYYSYRVIARYQVIKLHIGVQDIPACMIIITIFTSCVVQVIVIITFL